MRSVGAPNGHADIRGVVVVNSTSGPQLDQEAARVLTSYCECPREGQRGRVEVEFLGRNGGHGYGDSSSVGCRTALAAGHTKLDTDVTVRR